MDAWARPLRWATTDTRRSCPRFLGQRFGDLETCLLVSYPPPSFVSQRLISRLAARRPFGESGPWRVAQPLCQSPSNQPTCSGTLYLVGPDPLDQVCPRFALVASSRPCWFEMNDTTGLPTSYFIHDHGTSVCFTSSTSIIYQLHDLQCDPAPFWKLSIVHHGVLMGPLQNTEYSTLTCR